MSSATIPCPVCGHGRSSDGVCERCGVAFSSFAEPARDEPGDVLPLLRGLALAAGLLVLLALIGAGLFLRRGLAPDGVVSPRPADFDAPAVEVDAPTEARAQAEASRPPPLSAPLAQEADPGEPQPPGDRRPAGGLTAAELLAQGEDAETALIAGPPPEIDESSAAQPELSLSTQRTVRPGWYDGAEGYRTAIEQRADRPAPMVLYFRTDWCRYCRRFDEEYLANREVATWLGAAQRVQVNPEAGEAELALARRFGVRGYPAFFVIRPDADKQTRVHPFRKGRSISVSQFLVELKQAAGES